MANSVITTKEAFWEENRELKTPLPYAENTDILKESVCLSGKKIPNRLVCQAMEGCDGTKDGSPDELTIRRYDRFAEGGAGIIWFEATACLEEGRANPRQLWLREENVGDFARQVERIREKAMKIYGAAPLIVMQNTHSGRYSKPHGVPAPLIAYNNPIFEKDNPIPKDRIMTDDDLDRVKEAMVKNSILAEKAGFDGVDIKCCHRYLNSELLSAFEREGRYGGSFENRTRLLRETVEGAKSVCSSDFIVSTRLNVYDGFPYPYGFGVKEGGGTEFDSTEPVRLLQELSRLGVSLVNVTMGNPYFNPHVNRPYAAGGYEPPEKPLEGVARMLLGIASLKKQVPQMKIISSALSFLGVAAPHVAAAFVEEGGFDFAGFGRTIFAYPDFAKDILTDGEMKKEKLCICCSKCTEIMRTPGGTPGCVIRDRDVYLPIYQRQCKGERK